MSLSSTPAPLWLVVNPASGSNSAEAVRGVTAAFAAAGHPAAQVLDVTDGLPERRALEQAGVGTLAVFTGDGTINAVATA
ncbi:MAG: diacylglycerol kinase, partial [Sphingomonadales bacterium]|nr:diacylglycerol kinase [Sphingomonadales bacterium]